MPYVILKIFRPEIREIRKHSTHIVISNLIYKHDLSDRKWLRGGECMKDSELLGGRTKWTSRKCILRKEIILKNHFATVHENISTSWVFLKAWNKADKRKYEPLKYEKSLQVHVRVIWDEGREGGQLFVCIRQTCSFCRVAADKTLQIDPHFPL